MASEAAAVLKQYGIGEQTMRAEICTRQKKCSEDMNEVKDCYNLKIDGSPEIFLKKFKEQR